MTDGNQNIPVSYVYEVFGKIMGQNGGGGGPYQFCGLWVYRNNWDAGLMHVGARYYEPETGRWVQKDIILGFIFLPLTLNRYGYCKNNPINCVDPKGFWYVELSIGYFFVEISIAIGSKPCGGIGYAVSLEFEIGWATPIDVNLSGSMGDLESGFFWELDFYFVLGGEFGRYIRGGPIASIGIGAPQFELGVGYTWIL